MKSVNFTHLFQDTMPIKLYTSQQVYQMEQTWFSRGYDSFALMQQAAWQMTQSLISIYDYRQHNCKYNTYNIHNNQQRVSIWVGKGNNGGDGWLIALYLQQMGWQVQVVVVDNIACNDSNAADSRDVVLISDALKARNMAVAAGCSYYYFVESDFIIDADNKSLNQSLSINGNISNISSADVYIDALFGIGLDRAPIGIYKDAIHCFNNCAKSQNALVIAVDVPSGLVASNGQVFDSIAIRADITFCLVARKLGLQTKDGMDYAGMVIDFALIPDADTQPIAMLLRRAYPLSTREQNSHKGSYGHVLVIGGNQVDGSQGMGGAAILASASAMAAGAGKLTAACHQAFHSALLTSLPDAMVIDLHHQSGVRNLIKDANIIAIGMGLGRDDKAKILFIDYMQSAMTECKDIVIDADGLYHLASLHEENHELIVQLYNYSTRYAVYFTPHSGEAARLLGKTIEEIENNRLAAIKECAQCYGGNWVLKGSGSLILEQECHKVSGEVALYVCGLGNAGMATAGMGDVLSGVIAGLIAQQDLTGEQRSLRQAVLIHSLAADLLVSPQLTRDYQQQQATEYRANQISSGIRGLQAQDMPVAIRQVMHSLTI